MIRVGTVLYGYCGGRFGDSSWDKRVEGVGADWVVAREIYTNNPVFYEGDPEDLEEYTKVIDGNEIDWVENDWRGGNPGG